MATANIAYGTPVAMTVTNLNSLANSATAGWQSARVDNRTTLAMAYQVDIELDMADTAKANDSAIYVYMVPWLWNGSAWVAGADGGTTTYPSGSEGTYTIAAGNSLVPVKVIPYVAQNQVVHGSFQITAPTQGWSLVIVNYSGAAIAASGNSVNYVPITYTSA
jgi:hypothetical protein